MSQRLAVSTACATCERPFQPWQRSQRYCSSKCYGSSIKVERPSYRAMHTRVQTARGRAVSFSCAECSEPANEWAWIHDTDPFSEQNYQPMCHSHHTRYDQRKDTL